MKIKGCRNSSCFLHELLLSHKVAKFTLFWVFPEIKNFQGRDNKTGATLMKVLVKNDLMLNMTLEDRSKAFQN